MAIDGPIPLEATFSDLTEAYRALLAERSSPKAVRRLFTQFLELAFWLTERAVGGDTNLAKGTRRELGVASPAAKACFELRNALHDRDARVGFYARVETPLGQVGAAEVIGSSESYEEQSLPDTETRGPWGGVGIVFLPADPRTGEPDFGALSKSDVTKRMHVVPQRDRSKKELAAAGTRDVHTLAEQFYLVLESFYRTLTFPPQ